MKDKQYTPEEYKSEELPSNIIASDLISTSFDSQLNRILGNYSFGQLGAIQIGSYSSGVSGDIKISPNGIVARNKSNVTTFSVDGATGNVYVYGVLTVGSAAADVNAGSTTINGSKLTTGTVVADTVVSNWVYAGNISANQINAGTLSANYIYGGTLTVGGNGNGNGVIAAKDSSNNTGLYIDNTGLLIIDNRFNSITWADSNANLHGFISYSTSSLIFGSSSGKPIFINSDENLYLNTGSNGTVGTMQLHAGYFNMASYVSDINLYSHNKVYISSDNGADIELHASANIYLNPYNSGYISAGRDIGMNDHNINGCTTIYSYNFTNRSDVRLKKNIQDFSVTLDKLMKLIPVTFNYKSEDDESNKHVGLIAQEVEQVFPSLVIEDKDGIKGINYNELISIILSGLKEIIKIVNSGEKSNINTDPSMIIRSHEEDILEKITEKTEIVEKTIDNSNEEIIQIEMPDIKKIQRKIKNINIQDELSLN